MLEKENLVSRKDGSDVYKCNKCGHKVIRHGFGTFKRECPNGCDRDYTEVKGYWLDSERSIKNCICECGSAMMVVPKEGHANSKFWAFKRYEGEVLVCCARGCKVHIKRRPRK